MSSYTIAAPDPNAPPLKTQASKGVFGELIDSVLDIPREIGKEEDAARAQTSNDFRKEIIEGKSGRKDTGGLTGAAGIDLPLDYLGELGAVPAGAATSIVGRPVQTTTGIPKELTGNIIAMAVPFVGEANEVAAASRLAKEAGISVDMAKAAIERAKSVKGATLDEKIHNAVTDPKTGAARRLVKQGGLNIEEVRAKAKSLVGQHKSSGVDRPVLLDVLPQAGKRVVRAAGAKMGGADEILESHREETRGGLAGQMMGRTEQESKLSGSIEQRQSALKEKRDALAETKYREPYAHPLETDQRVFDILNVPEGIASINEAMSTARLRALDSPEAARQFHELKSIREYYTKRAAYDHEHEQWESDGGGTWEHPPNEHAKILLEKGSDQAKESLKRQLGWKPTPEPQPPEFPTVSGGSLDRVRIALRDKAQTLANAGKRAKAGGVGDRARALDEHLDTVPHLKEARAEYHDYSTRIEQLDFDKNLSSMRPDQFKAEVEKLSPEQRKERLHAVVEKLSAELGKSARGAQAGEDRLTTGPQFRENLRALLGPNSAHLADRYIRAIDLMGKKLDNATFVSSKGGSRTANLASDMAETGVKASLDVLMGRTHAALHKITSLLTGHFFGLQEESARQIAEWAVQQKDISETLDEIEAALKPKESGQRAAKTDNIPPEIKALLPAAHAAQQTAPGEPAEAPSGANKSHHYTIVPPSADSAPAASPEVPAASDDPYSDLMRDYTGGGSVQKESNQSSSGADHPLLEKVRMLEGSGDSAVSPKGAIGRYQITPATADAYHLDRSKLTDPAYAKKAANRILRDLDKRFDGDEAAVLVAYNAGPGRADKWLEAGKDMSVLPEETRKYLSRAGYGDDQGDQGDYEALLKQYTPGQAA